MGSTGLNIAIYGMVMLGMILFALAMFGIVVRFGPRRGSFMQPAAALRRPGRRMFVSMYALAALHVVLGLVAAIMMPGGGAAVLLVLVAMAVFYVLCAHSFSLASGLARRRPGATAASSVDGARSST